MVTEPIIQHISGFSGCRKIILSTPISIRYLAPVLLVLWVTCIYIYRTETPRQIWYRPARDLSNSITADPGEDPSEDQEFSLEEWKETQMRRRKRIGEVCSLRADLREMEPDPSEYLFEPENNILYCRHGKVGTTTFMAQLLSLSNLSNSTKGKYTTGPLLHSHLPNLLPLPTELDIRNTSQHSHSMSIVRHPLERLVSAYQNKIVEKPVGKYKQIRRKLEKIYGNASFLSFILYVLDSSRNWCRSYSSCDLDVHWLPYVSRCYYCEVPYIYILKFETFSTDLRGIQEVSHIPFKILKRNTSGGGRTSELATKYLTSLPYNVFRKLLRLYEADMEMFEYDPYQFTRS